MVGFIYVLGYVTFHFISHGFHIFRIKSVDPIMENVPSSSWETDDHKMKDIRVENLEYGKAH